MLVCVLDATLRLIILQTSGCKRIDAENDFFWHSFERGNSANIRAGVSCLAVIDILWRHF